MFCARSVCSQCCHNVVVTVFVAPFQELGTALTLNRRVHVPPPHRPWGFFFGYLSAGVGFSFLSLSSPQKGGPRRNVGRCGCRQLTADRSPVLTLGYEPTCWQASRTHTRVYPHRVGERFVLVVVPEAVELQHRTAPFDASLATRWWFIFFIQTQTKDTGERCKPRVFSTASKSGCCVGCPTPFGGVVVGQL